MLVVVSLVPEGVQRRGGDTITTLLYTMCELNRHQQKVKGAAYTTMPTTTVDTHQPGHCWWIFLHITVALFCMCVKYKVKINAMKQKRVKHSRWCASVLLIAGSSNALVDLCYESHRSLRVEWKDHISNNASSINGPGLSKLTPDLPHP